MNYQQWILDVLFLGASPLSCGGAWWFWVRERRTAPVLTSRRWVVTCVGLLAVTASVVFGAFAYIYWQLSPESNPGPPLPTYVATNVGFALVLLAVPSCAFAKAWTRIALTVCSLGLLGFYFLMYLSP